jgi:hypothetical protein
MAWLLQEERRGTTSRYLEREDDCESLALETIFAVSILRHDKKFPKVPHNQQTRREAFGDACADSKARAT